MGKPFDVSKFRKTVIKSIDGINIGFHDPKIWISTGNYALNYRISGNFDRGVPLGKVTVFAGQPAAGKSLIVSGNIVKNAQDLGIYVILIDTENALDEPWLKAFDVDTSEEKLLKINMSMTNDVAKLISDFVKEYKQISEEDRPPILFVIDSLGMLLAPTQVDQFEKGDMKGDMGIKAKQLKALVTNCVNMFGALNIGMVATNHTYVSQDPYSPDDIVSGGSGFVFASSIVVAMKPLKLKEDSEGVKGSDVLGIRAGCKIMKSRYSKPFESMEVLIPYSSGLDKFSGLFDLFIQKQVITKDGNRYSYTDANGVEHKHWRKDYLTNHDNILELIMKEWNYSREKEPNIKKEETLIEPEE
jgi:RecA/RadA recombinase